MAHLSRSQREWGMWMGQTGPNNVHQNAGRTVCQQEKTPYVGPQTLQRRNSMLRHRSGARSDPDILWITLAAPHYGPSTEEHPDSDTNETQSRQTADHTSSDGSGV